MVRLPGLPTDRCPRAIRECRRQELRNRLRRLRLPAPWCSFHERNPWSPGCPGIKRRYPCSESRCASRNPLLLRRRDGLCTDHTQLYLMPFLFLLTHRERARWWPVISCRIIDAARTAHDDLRSPWSLACFLLSLRLRRQESLKHDLP